MRATRVRVAAIARGQNARARVDVRRIAETATARVGAGGRVFAFFARLAARRRRAS